MDFPELTSRLYLDCQPIDDQAARDFFYSILAPLCHYMKEMFRVLKTYDFARFHYDYGAIDYWIERLENFIIDYNSANFVTGHNINVVSGDQGPNELICQAEHAEYPLWIENLVFHQQDFIKYQVERITDVYKDFLRTANFTDYWCRKPILKHAIFVLKCLEYENNPAEPLEEDADSGLSSSNTDNSDNSDDGGNSDNEVAGDPGEDVENNPEGLQDAQDPLQL